jgi:hypothetical protein
MILAAIQTKTDRKFTYQHRQYRVVDYLSFDHAQKYLDIISRFCNPTEPKTVYVFSHKNVHQFPIDTYEMVTAMIPCAQATFPIPVSVYYNRHTRQYFINEVTYTDVRKRYGLPYLRLAQSKESGHGFGNLKEHSALNLLGYNVSEKNGMTSQGRRKLLESIIDSGVLTKAEIMNHLEWLIRTQKQNHMENAVAEWKSDLRHVTAYRAREQRIVWVKEFRAKYSKGNATS